MTLHPLRDLLLFCAAFLAGMANSLAGGGTLLTFPALLAAGFSARVANATNTMALWPGVISSLWGYRRYVSDLPPILLWFGVPGVLGGLAGALLLTHTTDTLFGRIVPWLLLATTLLFASQGLLTRRARERAAHFEAEPLKDRPPFSPFWIAASLLMGCFAFYGGYFGAGLGILILTLLGYVGFQHMHRMNGIKNCIAGLVNLMALLVFVFSRVPQGEGVGAGKNLLIDWPIAFLMMTGSIGGGLTASHYAKRIGQQNVRRIVIAIGLAISVSLLLHPPG